MVLALKKKPARRRARQTSPRKDPRQARSASTVEAILRATARILTRDGYDQLTTNKVSEVAGVSVGSLYQYFPNKEALVSALVQRHFEELEKILTPDPSVLTAPLEELAHRLISAMIRAKAVDPKLHRELIQVAPRIGLAPDLIFARGTALVLGLLSLHSQRIRKADPELVAFIIVAAVEAIAHRATLENRYLDDPRLVEEVVTLLLRYVTPA